MRGLGSLLAATAAVSLASACGGTAASVPRVDAAAPSGASRPSVLPANRSAPPPAVVRALPGETLAAQLRSPVALRDAPRPGARVLLRAAKRTEFGSKALLAVVAQRPGWLGVVHPGLGNGAVGWVRAGRVRMLREPWSVAVDLSRRTAALRRRGEVVKRFPVAVGSAVHPTPTGTFGVTDRLSTGGPGSNYGCCVLALSGRQPNVPQDWPGGDRLAIHGTDAPETIGTAASLGCLRASEQAMRLLMRRVPLGARVVIRA